MCPRHVSPRLRCRDARCMPPCVVVPCSPSGEPQTATTCCPWHVAACVARTAVGMLTDFPFGCARLSPAPQGRVTHVYTQSTWKPSPHQSKRVYFYSCYYHQDQQRARLHVPSRTTLQRHARACLLVGVCEMCDGGRTCPRTGHAHHYTPPQTMRRRRGLGPGLERDPFSGPLDSTGELVDTP